MSKEKTSPQKSPEETLQKYFTQNVLGENHAAIEKLYSDIGNITALASDGKNKNPVTKKTKDDFKISVENCVSGIISNLVSLGENLQTGKEEFFTDILSAIYKPLRLEGRTSSMDNGKTGTVNPSYSRTSSLNSVVCGAFIELIKNNDDVNNKEILNKSFKETLSRIDIVNKKTRDIVSTNRESLLTDVASKLSQETFRNEDAENLIKEITAQLTPKEIKFSDLSNDERNFFTNDYELYPQIFKLFLQKDIELSKIFLEELKVCNLDYNLLKKLNDIQNTTNHDSVGKITDEQKKSFTANNMPIRTNSSDTKNKPKDNNQETSSGDNAEDKSPNELTQLQGDSEVAAPELVEVEEGDEIIKEISNNSSDVAKLYTKKANHSDSNTNSNDNQESCSTNIDDVADNLSVISNHINTNIDKSNEQEAIRNSIPNTTTHNKKPRLEIVYSHSNKETVLLTVKEKGFENLCSSFNESQAILEIRTKAYNIIRNNWQDSLQRSVSQEEAYNNQDMFYLIMKKLCKTKLYDNKGERNAENGSKAGVTAWAEEIKEEITKEITKRFTGDSEDKGKKIEQYIKAFKEASKLIQNDKNNIFDTENGKHYENNHPEKGARSWRIVDLISKLDSSDETNSSDKNNSFDPTKVVFFRNPYEKDNQKLYPLYDIRSVEEKMSDAATIVAKQLVDNTNKITTSH